jgi:hypothetical protein
MENQGFYEDNELQRRYRGQIRNKLGSGPLKRLKPPYTEEELSIIAGVATTSGMFSRNDVYNAFRAAGLNHEGSLEEVRRRIW